MYALLLWKSFSGFWYCHLFSLYCSSLSSLICTYIYVCVSPNPCTSTPVILCCLFSVKILRAPAELTALKFSPKPNPPFKNGTPSCNQSYCALFLFFHSILLHLSALPSLLSIPTACTKILSQQFLSLLPRPSQQAGSSISRHQGPPALWSTSRISHLQMSLQ